MKTILVTLFLLGQSVALAAGSGGVFVPRCQTLAGATISAGEYEEATGVDFKTHFTQKAIDLYSSGVEVSKGTFIKVEDLKRQPVIRVVVTTDCPNEDPEAIFMTVTQEAGSLLKRKTRDSQKALVTKRLHSDMIEYVSDIGVLTRDFSGLSKTDLALGNADQAKVVLELPEITVVK